MEFIKDNIFLVVTILAFVIFAIIGYVVDSTKNRKNSKKEKEVLTEEFKPNEELDIDLTDLSKK